MNKRTKIASLAGTLFVSVFFSLVTSTVTLAADPEGQIGNAACQAPETDLGSSSDTFVAQSAGTYRIWSRINAPDANNNSYYLEVDGEYCYTVGDSQGTPANEWTWVDYENGDGNAKIDIQLEAGEHTVKMIGREAGLKLDKIMFLSDTNCVPEGKGDNCAGSEDGDSAAPIAELTSHKDGDSVSGVVNLVAQANDDEGGAGVSKVEFYANDSLVGTATEAPYTAEWDASNLADGNYTLKVKAFDQTGNTSTHTVNVRVQNGTPDNDAPSVPGNVRAEAPAHNSVKLTWDKSTDNVGVAGYRIYRNNSQIDDLRSSESGEQGVQEPASSYTDSTVAPNTEYKYRVVAYDQINNESDPSSEVTVKTPTSQQSTGSADTEAPSVPRNFTAEMASKTQINLRWEASTDNVKVASYDIYRSSGGSAAESLGTWTSTSVGNINLSENTEYSYYVVAVDAAGNRSQPSETVKASTGGSGDLVSIDGDGATGVVEGGVNNGVQGVKVRIFVFGVQRVMRTDSEGNYKAAGLPSGKYPVIFTHPEYFLNGTWVEVDNGQVTVANVSMFTRDIDSLVNSFWNRT